MPAFRAYYYVPSLARIRIEHRMRQQDLADLAGVSRQNIAQLEMQKNRQRARMSTIEKLATALDVTVDELMQEEKPTKKKHKEEVHA